ncbi:MAG: DUF2480 family protein [Fidelibacterota bacterium]
METIYMDDFLDNGILREESFRKSVDEIDWSRYREKRVLIKGCSEAPVPTWAYLILTAKLVPYADRILYGEPCTSVRIFDRLRDKPARLKN